MAGKVKTRVSAAQKVVRGLLKQRTIGGIEELNEQLIEQFGGIVGFARELKSQYDIAENGSVAKQRLLSSVLQIATLAHKQAPERMDEDHISDDDLAALIKDYMTPDTVAALKREADES